MVVVTHDKRRRLSDEAKPTSLVPNGERMKKGLIELNRGGRNTHTKQGVPPTKHQLQLCTAECRDSSTTEKKIDPPHTPLQRISPT